MKSAGSASSFAASAMVKRRNDGGKRPGSKPVRLHRNRRKNLTRAEKLDPALADWPSIAAVAQSFNPAVIPLPIRMGRPRPNKVGDVPPIAQGNIELLKIPNFFHLTPPAIERHCAALKPLCTPWPENMTKKPIRIVTNNYIYPGPSIRHPDSKIVKLQVYLKDLELDEHAQNKLILLAGPERYCKNTDELTITADRCPTRTENKDYALYLLTALYQEAWRTEDWEGEMPKDIELSELQKMISNTLAPQAALKEKKQRVRNVTRVVAGKLVRFNRYGKAFVVENMKHDIKGPPGKEDVQEIRQEWDKIKP
eukprot:gene12771-14082_t